MLLAVTVFAKRFILSAAVVGTAVQIPSHVYAHQAQTRHPATV